MVVTYKGTQSLVVSQPSETSSQTAFFGHHRCLFLCCFYDAQKILSLCLGRQLARFFRNRQSDYNELMILRFRVYVYLLCMSCNGSQMRHSLYLVNLRMFITHA